MASGPVSATPPGPSLATLIGDMDWSTTLVGARERWPASLAAAVRFIVASGFPMAIRWGPDFVLIYNEGYRAILGDKHPGALGRPFKEVWPEVQPQLGPLHEAILAGSTGATFQEDLLLRIQRYGERWEDARFTISYSPIPDESSATGVGGVLITAVETTERVQMEEALRASEERFSRIFQQTSVGIIECALDGRFLLANKRFAEIMGRTQEELRDLRMQDLVPDAEKEDQAIRFRGVVEDGISYTSERCFVRPDGTEVWASNNVTCTRDADGKPLRVICVVQDITARKRAIEQQSLLVGELNHRVKNLFTVASSMIALSARTAKTPQDLARNLRGRMDALAAAHDLILPQGSHAGLGGQRIQIAALVNKILAPYAESEAAGEKPRLAAAGQALEIGAHAVECLALVLHELATNAAKYGALSVPDGSVRIGWQKKDDVLEFDWTERGGPVIAAPPSTGGFGTVLSNRSIKSQLGGTLTHSWSPQGLTVAICVPMDRLQS